MKREAFERYLEHARKKGSVRGFQGTVRLQWDPDHYPNGSPHPYRRAVQLGLKNVKGFADGEDILCIKDVSEFVHQQAPKVGTEELLVARERVYWPSSEEAVKAMELSPFPKEGDENERRKKTTLKKANEKTTTTTTTTTNK